MGVRKEGQEQGQTIVELGLVMSLLALVVLGVFDIGRFMGTSEQITNAVREGAKVAAEYYTSYQNNQSGLTALVKNSIVDEGQLDASRITNLQISIQNPANPDYSNEQIVQVSFQYKFSFYGPWTLVPGLTNPYTMGAVTSAQVTE